MDQNQDSSEFVEVDPTGRYGRYNEILGKGASKIVYRAFDEYEGIEVAWNQVKLNDFLQSSDDLERLYCEIHLLKTLKHKNIMKFYTSWVDASNRNINFVTEMFTSGTLRQYRQKHKTVNMRAIKHWCRQILEGLLYLHSLYPPVIHRDLKCDNIFINGNQGVVKIGDLGLAAILRKSYVDHCVGTPEFMAPEVYKEEYNELVDIYSFGMCVLEMVTLEYPYSECTHPAQIYKKVVSGTKPEALNRINDPEVRQFIEECLAMTSERPSATELLNHRFLQTDDSDDDGDFDGVSETSHEFFSTKEYGYCSSHDSHTDRFVDNNDWDSDAHDLTIHGINLFDSHEDDPIANVGITIKGRRRDGGIFLRLRITDTYGHARNIHFPFDTKTDTALSVATEMVSELDIHDYEVEEIANMIDNEVSSLVPDWVAGSYISETSRFPHIGVCGICKPNLSSEGSVLDFISKTRNCYECAMHGRFEEITYQEEGASIFSTSKSDEDYDKHRNVSHCDSEFDKELNWIMAKYKIEQRKLKNRKSGKKAKVMHSSPDLRNCRLENDFQAPSSSDDHQFFTAKQFYCLGDLLPNCISRTKSFPDYAVDV